MFCKYIVELGVDLSNTNKYILYQDLGMFIVSLIVLFTSPKYDYYYTFSITSFLLQNESSRSLN